MKELSIEEKAKRFDEAINKMKHYVVDEYGCSRIKVADVFPELKESEEMIRKEIINYIKSAIGDEDIVLPWIAWLEKQKTSEEALQYLRENHSSSEMSDFQSAMNIAVAKAYDKGYNDGLNVIKCFEQGEKKSKKASLWKHWKDGIAGNGEGKLIYLVKEYNTYRLTSCLGFECDYIELSELDKLLSEKQGEQKPAELPKGEDYGIDGLYAAIDILQNTLGKVNGYQSDDGILEHKCAISAVKQLYEQKPAEWSEEDKELFEEIKRCVGIQYPLGNPCIFKFLKSLKERVGNFDDGYKVGFSAAKHNQWKSSDEQMQVLR